MKNQDLINQLLQFPSDMEVCIFDEVKNEADASDEPSSAGVEPNFKVYQVHSDEEFAEMKAEFPDLKNFVALSFSPKD